MSEEEFEPGEYGEAPAGSIKDAAHAREAGYKRALQKLLEKAFALVNSVAHFTNPRVECNDEPRKGDLVLQLVEIDPSSLPNMGLAICQDAGKGGMWPLAFVADPRAIQTSYPLLWTDDFEEFNRLVQSIADVEMEVDGEKFRFGSNSDLRRTEEAEALDEIEEVAKWSSEKATETANTREMAKTLDKAGLNNTAIAKAIGGKAEYDPPTMEDTDE